MKKPRYTPNPAGIKRFFEAIQDLGTPPKVNRLYLDSIGFKSSNDRYIIGILKFLGFISDTNAPQPLWNDFKNKSKAGKVMASAVKIAYDDLFRTYPDANRREASELQNFFAPTFGFSSNVSKLVEQTFRRLCDLADFAAIAEGVTEPAVPPIGKVAELPAGARGVAININIQLHLPATENADIYDKLFSALKKHLFS